MTKPIPFGVKVRKLLANAYYLPKEKFNEMIIELEHHTPYHTVPFEADQAEEDKGQLHLTDMQYCIWVVDQYGEWLH